MKNKILKIICALSVLAVLSFGGIATTFAALRWFDSSELEDNSVFVKSWIKVTVTSAEAFAADEELTVRLAVKQWAEGGNYKLVITGIDYYCSFSAAVLDPDYLWEFYADNNTWEPISNAMNLVVIPEIDLKKHMAILKIRTKPDVFLTAGFADYLDYNLELTAALVSY